MDHDPTLQFTQISVYLLRERLVKRFEEIGRGDFEAYAFDWLCCVTCPKPAVQSRAGCLEDDGYHRVISLQGHEVLVLGPASKTCPLLDFALFITKWFNAKAVCSKTTAADAKEHFSS
eukprot:GFKZ01013312.1.p3 GENE.GFKZ01013312.1~~GFKZ01013312.1.p3  ORF type:complete len:118 (-),score=11.49 GFKZ01013312.1:1129-1482(-)